MEVSVILHPTVGSEPALKALDMACDLAASHHARLVILHAQARAGGARIPAELEQYERLEHAHVTEAEMLAGAAQAVVDAAASAARSRGVSAVSTAVEIGDPTGVILDAARREKADMIVLGSRGLGDLQGLLMSSVSHKIAHAAPCSCVVVR